MRFHVSFALLTVLPSFIAHVLPRESPDPNADAEQFISNSIDSGKFLHKKPFMNSSQNADSELCAESLDLTDVDQALANPVDAVTSNAVAWNQSPSPSSELPLVLDTGSIVTSCQDGKTNKIRSEKKQTSANRNADISLIENEDDNSENSCPASSVAASEKLPKTNPPTSPQPLSAPDALDSTVYDNKNNNGCKPQHPIRLCSNGEPESFSTTLGLWRMVYDCFTCKLVVFICLSSPPSISERFRERSVSNGLRWLHQGCQVALRRKTGVVKIFW